MRPPAWVRNTAVRWLSRFFCRRQKPRPQGPSATLKEVKLYGVRADWCLVSAEGVGLGILQRHRMPRWTVRCPAAAPALRALGLYRPVASITPADLGLPSMVAQRVEDGVKVYFGERDDMTALLADTRSCP